MSSYSFKYTIISDDCDKLGRISIPYLLELFTQSAIRHYDSLGISRDRLEEENLRFLLMQTSAKIHRLPKDGDTIIVSTNEIGIDGIFFDRRYEVSADNGELLISADSHWILTDRSHRILSPKKFPFKVDNGEPAEISCKRMPKYSITDFTSGIIHKTEPDYIDLNGHVHNTVYAQIACEYMPLDFWDKNWIEFHINWRNEAKLGDEWELFTSNEENLSSETYSCVGFIGELSSFDFSIVAEKNS